MKFHQAFVCMLHNQSLPLRERGLKSGEEVKYEELGEESLPLRERGLKFNTLGSQCSVNVVAPLAGAWIEIHLKRLMAFANGVAPLAGAWIEIQPHTLTAVRFGCRSPCGSVD